MGETAFLVAIEVGVEVAIALQRAKGENIASIQHCATLWACCAHFFRKRSTSASTAIAIAVLLLSTRRRNRSSVRNLETVVGLRTVGVDMKKEGCGTGAYRASVASMDAARRAKRCVVAGSQNLQFDAH